MAHKPWQHLWCFLPQPRPRPLLPAGLTGPVWSSGRHRHRHRHEHRPGRGWEQGRSWILVHIWRTDRDAEMRRRESDGGRSQICCLAQDQSQDKVINLKQDVSPLTVFFIFRVGGERGSKNPNRCRRSSDRGQDFGDWGGFAALHREGGDGITVCLSRWVGHFGSWSFFCISVCHVQAAPFSYVLCKYKNEVLYSISMWYLVFSQQASLDFSPHVFISRWVRLLVPCVCVQQIERTLLLLRQCFFFFYLSIFL